MLARLITPLSCRRQTVREEEGLLLTFMRTVLFERLGNSFSLPSLFLLSSVSPSLRVCSCECSEGADNSPELAKARGGEGWPPRPFFLTLLGKPAQAANSAGTQALQSGLEGVVLGVW